MKEQYVRDLSDNQRVDTIFALRSRDIRSARTGDPFLALELADSTGRISAVMFRPSGTEEALPVGSAVRVRGRVTTYRGAKRVTVEGLSPVETYDAADLLPSGIRDRGELLEELRGLVRGIKNPRLRGLVRSIFGAPGFIEAFTACPAGSGRHHAYVGGLLEHTVSVATLCVSLSAAYPQVDGDLLLAAALLHDIGKTEELACGTSLDYTDAGRLVGHVVLGERMVTTAIRAQSRPLPEDLALRLSHALLAHHGSPEWGAPRPPATLEALLLHHADHLDAQASAFLGAVSGAAVLEQTWSDGSNGFGRPLMVPADPSRSAERVCA
jgi:3'-5' exoribonuclease